MMVSSRAGFLHAVRLVVLSGALALVFAELTLSGATLEPVTEAQVKAAFLFNFAKFVEWPGESNRPLVIGVLGDDPFEAIVIETVRGHKIFGQEVRTRHLVNGDDPSDCHIVFVGDMRPHDAAEFMHRVRGPTLIVGEGAQFLRDGGMVRFYREQNRVRFQISQKNAESAGLKVSSQLLALAAR
jgi:hypothetical protein